MSHIAKTGSYWAEEAVGRPWACVKVRVEGRRLVVVAGGIGVLRRDAMVAPLPKEIEVVDEDGERIAPERGFYITTGSLDPYHLLTDGLPP